MFRIILTTILLWGITDAIACDICGCSVNGNNFGILPKFNKNFVGVRYQYRSFTSKPHNQLSEHTSAGSDYFHTAEIWGKYLPVKRIQIFTFIPYHNYQRKEGSNNLHITGLGDMSILTHLVLINTGDSIRKKWKQALQIGGGIKLPTGRYDLIKDSQMVNQNLQPGTGSFDFPINLIYTLRNKKVGLNTELNYSFNSSNKQNYQFGNRLNAGLLFFYWQKVKRLSVIPQLGVNYEKAQSNRANMKQVEFTGSEALFGSAGLGIYYSNIAFGFEFKKPIFESNSRGYVNTRQRISTSLIYLF